MTASVLAQCRAAPDDDAPRLVWADLVGGERGELVVLQCDLARGGLAPREIAMRRARERELLERHGHAWAGSLAKVASRWTFRRGFIESARLDLALCDPGTFDEHPLLDALALDNWAGNTAELQLPIRSRLRGLVLESLPFYPPGVGYERVRTSELPFAWMVNAGSFDHLRAIGFDTLNPDHLEPLAKLIARAPIEQLWLRRCGFSTAQLPKLLELGSRWHGLELQTTWNTPLADVGHVPLRALRLSSVNTRELEVLAHSPITQTLELLGFRSVEPVGAGVIDAFAVRTLELSGEGVAIAVRAALASPRADRLRVLRADVTLDEDLVAQLADRFGEQLESLAIRNVLPAELRARFAGDVVTLPDDPRPPPRRTYEPLASAMFDDAGSLSTLAGPLVLERLDRPGRWEYTHRATDAPLTIGRNSFDDIRVPDLGEFEAGFYWRFAWELHAFHRNTFEINSKRVTQTLLRDGAVIRCGPATFRFSGS